MLLISKLTTDLQSSKPCGTGIKTKTNGTENPEINPSVYNWFLNNARTDRSTNSPPNTVENPCITFDSRELNY